jgi:hypothetical protein
MRQRLFTLLCAAGAFALFYAFFIGPREPESEKPSRPTTVEVRENGYLGAVRWLENTGVPVVKLRHRYDWLLNEASALPAQGNLLITTMPYVYGVRAREWEAIHEWLDAGNTLLVMAALGDTPDWAFGLENNFSRQLTRLTGIDFIAGSAVAQDSDESEDAQGSGDSGDSSDKESSDTENSGKQGRESPSVAVKPLAIDWAAKLKTPERSRMVPNREHPLFEGVKACTAESEYPADEWIASVPDKGFVLTLAHEEPSGSAAFWMRRHGHGTVLISTYASLFTNQLIGEADNARLLANIVRHALEPGGKVLFDDTHQGLTELYDPEAFFADQRLAITLWLIVGFWLVWVLGATRLRAAPASPATPQERSLVEATGAFLAQVLAPVTAGRRMCTLFFNEVHRRLGHVEDGSAPWDWLERQPYVAPQDLAALRRLHERLVAGRRVDLATLHNLTVRLQEQLR